jgi:glucokinase
MSELVMRMWVRVSNAFYRDDGQTVAEYALVVAVIVAGLALALAPTGGTSIAQTIVNKITTALGKF